MILETNSECKPFLYSEFLEYLGWLGVHLQVCQFILFHTLHIMKKSEPSSLLVVYILVIYPQTCVGKRNHRQIQVLQSPVIEDWYFRATPRANEQHAMSPYSDYLPSETEERMVSSLI